jgi:hypothetical protein
LLLNRVGINKWACGDVKSLAEFKAQASEHEPPIKWHRCSDGVIGTVEVPGPVDCEETNILADRRALRRLEIIAKKVEEVYDCTAAEIYEVHSFGWSDWEEDEEGRLGIREITLAGRNSLFVKIEGNMIFAQGTDSRRCEAENKFLRKECEGFSWGGEGDGFECYFFERVIIPMVLKNGKLDALATALGVGKAANLYCDEFETRILRVTERLEAYRKRLDSRKKRDSQKRSSGKKKDFSPR